MSMEQIMEVCRNRQNAETMETFELLITVYPNASRDDIIVVHSSSLLEGAFIQLAALAGSHDAAEKLFINLSAVVMKSLKRDPKWNQLFQASNKSAAATE